MESGMSHQDADRDTASALHHQDLNQALNQLLSSVPLSDVTFRKECTWTSKGLIYVAILWAWSDEKTLTARFALARKVVMVMGILGGIPATSYQAFLKMLKIWTIPLTLALAAAFRRLMEADLADRGKIAGFSVFGVDGSRLELPRTVSNEARFSPASAHPQAKPKRRGKPRRRGRARTHAARARRARQKKTNCPQMWLTTLFHVGTGLPWDWRLGPSDSSERGHLLEMLAVLPVGALVTADAGFVGYDVWKSILGSRRHLLVRVGANVRLLKKLGYAQEKNGLVYLWPDREAKQKQPPLVLRLVVANNGKHPVYLVTSVLEEARLSDRQVVAIYRLRWGIELFYRHFKQTYERRKLRSHTADNAEIEATWSLIGLWSMALHTQLVLAPSGVPARRISVAKLLYAYRRSLREYKSPPDPGESLRELLSKAIIDAYERADKTSRDYPRKKYEPATGAPKVHNATKDQINAARSIGYQLASGLTA
jgi:hypothetical protein